jgi:hypothetical protein
MPGNENIFVTYCPRVRDDSSERLWRSALMTMFRTNIWGKELITKANEYAKEYKFFCKERKKGEYL